jgi:hypothetical protein
MTRYFFDLVSQQHSQHDFRGRELPTLEEARRLAELIAIDLATGPEDQWAAGWNIAVRGADERELFAVPIQARALTAA